MSDDHKNDYRTAPGDIAEDDPLAELARIIGYDRPKDARPQVDVPQTVPELDVFDLEAELMRELDQTQFEVPAEPRAEAQQHAPAPEAEPDVADEWAGDESAEFPADAEPFAAEQQSDADAVVEPLAVAQEPDSDDAGDIFADEDFVFEIPDQESETLNADVSPDFAKEQSFESDAAFEPAAVEPDLAAELEAADIEELPSPEREAPSELDYSAWNDDDDTGALDVDSAFLPLDDEAFGYAADTQGPSLVDVSGRHDEPETELDDDADEARDNAAWAPVVPEDAMASEDDFTLEDIELDNADREQVAGFADQFYADDDVLADMERFSGRGEQGLADRAEHEARSSSIAESPALSGDEVMGGEQAGGGVASEMFGFAPEPESDAGYEQLLDIADDSDFHADVELELPPELAAELGDIDDEVSASSEAGHEAPQSVQSSAPSDTKAQEASRYTDFEDELAAELDVYQQEMHLADADTALTDSFMGFGVPAESISIEADEDEAFAAAADDFVEAGVVAEHSPEFDEAELAAQFDAWSPATERDRTVVDSAEAEADDDADMSGFDFDLGPELEQALARSIDDEGEAPSPSAELPGNEEVEIDPFVAPADVVPFIASDDAEADDEAADFDRSEFDDLWAEAPATPSASPDDVELELDAADLEADDEYEDESPVVDEPEPEAVDRDEIASAFLDLLSGPGDEPAAAAQPPAAVGAEYEADAEAGNEAVLPAATAWLGGMSGQATAAEPVETSDFDTDTASTGEGGFDAAALAETDYALEQIGEFDVPSIPHDDPVEPAEIDDDFVADIEREFAQLVDAETPDSYAGSEAEIAGMAASAAAWPGVAKASEEIIPDNYYNLEDNLDSRPNGDFADDDFTVRSSPQPVHAGEVYETEAADQRHERGGRGPVLALMVLGLAVVGGLGVFGWSMLSDGGPGGSDAPRIIRADKEPVKVVPENPGGLVVPNQEKAVYEKVDGGDVSNPTQPSLVTSAEEPVDVVQRTLDPSFLPLEGESEAEPVKAEDRLAPDQAEPDPAPAIGGVVVAPRKVRTMVVRPDGTIVAREEPDPQPEAKTEETAAATTEPSQTVAAAEPVATAAEPAAAVEPAPPAASEPAPATDAATAAPVRVVKTQPITQPAVAAPVPQARPADQPVNVVSTVTDKGNVNVPATPTQGASTPAVSNPGGYYMQIASQPTPEGAQASYNNLSKRFASVIGNRGVQIQRADIPGKGVYHRVRIPAGSRDEANALCSRYKAAGGNCLVTR